MKETFKDLKLEGFPQYDGLYSIGDKGELVSKERTSISTDHNGNDYPRTLPERVKIPRCSKKSPLLFSDLYATIYDKNGDPVKHSKTVYIHKLVAIHFLERPKDKSKDLVTHVDPKKPQLNTPENVMWCDQSFLSSRNMEMYPHNRDNLKKANIKSGYYKGLGKRNKNKNKGNA